MRQGNIWLINLDPTVGAEIKKTRPCVILNNDSIGILPLKVVAPITDFKEQYEDVPWMVKLIPDDFNKLKKISVIDIFQVRCISKERLIKRLGIINDSNLKDVFAALRVVFGM